MEKQEHAGWTWAGRADLLWSLVDRFGTVIGALVVIAAGPTGHAIGGVEALYYVIPITALGIFMCWAGFRRYARRNTIGAIVAPVRREYKRERIHVVELASQYGGVLRDLTFIECEIMGPVVFCGAGGVITNHEPHLYLMDDTSAFVEMPGRQTRPDGMIGVSDCIFKQCHFHRVTWAMPREVLDIMRRELKIPLSAAPAQVSDT